MRKYILVVKNTWNEMLAYRVNFTMWRIRNVLVLLTTYFLWSVIIPQNKILFGYTHEEILTYVLGSSLIASIVFASRTQEIGDNINSGALSVFLVKPIHYFGYWFAKDIGDKAMNISFSLAEIIVLIVLLHPPLYIQTSLPVLLITAAVVLLAMLLQFIIGSMIGMIGFWSPEVWAPRFIYFILLTFLAGSLFPLDVLPVSVRTVMYALPFPYLLYFPLKVYLGQAGLQDAFHGITVMLIWLFILGYILNAVWKKGLKEYIASGQ